MLFSICILATTAQAQFSSDEDTDDNTPAAAANYDPDDVTTDVPFDDYVPFLVAGIVVYGVWMNRQKKAVQQA